MKKRSSILGKRVLTLMMTGIMCTSLLAGCGSENKKSSTESNTTSDVAATDETKKEEEIEVVKATYPLRTDDTTLTVYLRDSSSGVVGNWGDIEAFKMAMEKLGVTLKFIHPAVGSEADQFNLMIASNEYPDIILWDYSTTPMGMEQLVNEGVLIDMDQYIRQYAPNYLNVLKGNEEYAKEATSDSGHYLGMYSFASSYPVSGGPTLRGDLLKKNNLEVPVTVDDWTNVMTKLKESGDTKYPLTSGKGRDGSVLFDLILPAYKTSNGFCLDETGNVVYGPSTENFKEYLTKLNEWYNAELIDPEFMSNDGKSMNAKLADGTCVAGSLQLNYHIANITNTARQTNPEFEFEGTTWPTLNKGDKPSFPIGNGTYYSGLQATVTSACKDPVLATQVLDYFYSEEGNDLVCWGIEGKSYTKAADGTKTYTDGIMKNADGKTPQEAILQYAIPTYAFSNIILLDSYLPMVTSLPEQNVARERWLDADTGVNMPRVTVAPEVQNEFNTIMNQINTYQQEMYIGFITGQANLNSDWETYVDTLKGMGIDTATQYKQEAYILYQSR
ncbi:extracellular solute-binding protein [Candidatus Galacturonibacter soehngenii]|uniref:Extracellular solute-binding protein n=1 Tax=Candidatus Galacturonatibacter soehngenii TaxID=2307010 RepID=A0A7V7QI29_9FIRM|nr:extracellular solute-binding protein [Candidatus Galacturonibacter soehngenii]KAB1435725.1 extracellular solute-binding protein [Candidatus Galacturonibacter soehngenii]